jgi:hypothetical protein
MDSTNDPIHKRLGDFCEEQGFTFVGISDEKEVFLSFSDGTPQEKILAAKVAVKEQFGEEITTVATVVSVSMEEVTQMVDGLNAALADLEKEEEKPQLLDIGSF